MQTVRCRNRDAVSAYLIVAGGWMVVPAAGLFSGPRANLSVVSAGALILLALLRYLTPLHADVTPTGVTFRWPLRRVTVTASTLVAVTPFGSSRGTFGLRVRRSIRWGVAPGRYDNTSELAQALREIIGTANIDDNARREVLRQLRR